MIDDYVNSLKIQRHESAGRWYSQGKSLNWKPSVTTIIGETCSKGKFFDEWLMKNGMNAEKLRDEAAERGTAVHEAIRTYGIKYFLNALLLTFMGYTQKVNG